MRLDRRRRGGEHRLRRPSRGALCPPRASRRARPAGTPARSAPEPLGGTRRDQNRSRRGRAVELFPRAVSTACGRPARKRLVLFRDRAHDPPSAVHAAIYHASSRREQLERALDQLRHVVLLVEARRLRANAPQSVAAAARVRRGPRRSRRRELGEEEVVRVDRDGAQDGGRRRA